MPHIVDILGETDQPDSFLEINWDDPLTKKLAYASALAGNSWDAVRQRFGTNTAVIRTAAAGGEALQFTSASSSGIVLPTTAMVSGYPLTVSCWADLTDSGGGEVLFSLNGTGWSAIAGNTNAGQDFLLNDDCTTSSLVIQPVSGLHHLIIAFLGGGVAKVYLEGVFTPRTRSAGNTGWGRPAAGNNSIGYRLAGSSAKYNNGPIRDFCVWGREVSSDEALQIYQNSRRVFKRDDILTFFSTGGGAFTPSITEAITLADTASQVASLSASISESLPLSHSQTALANFPATITEAATLSHSQDAIVGYAVSNTETLNLSHSQTNVANFPATITEAMTLADSGSVQFGATSTISEAMTLADSSSNVAALSASITESMTLADSPNASASGDYTATQTEAMSLADTASNVAALSASITAPMSLSDSQSNVASLSASISESMTLADTSSSSLSGAAYSATITEAMTLGDTAAVQAALSAALTEAMSLGENATAAWMTYVTIVESLNLDASQDIVQSYVATIVETIQLAATVGVTLNAAYYYAYVILVAADIRDSAVADESRTLSVPVETRGLLPVL